MINIQKHVINIQKHVINIQKHVINIQKYVINIQMVSQEILYLWNTSLIGEQREPTAYSVKTAVISC